MKTKLIILIIIILTVVGGYYFILREQEIERTPTIKLGELNFAHPAISTLVVAREKGFFEKESINVKSEFFNTGKDALNALIAGNVDVITVAETPLAYLGFVDTSVQVFANIAVFNDTQLIARKDREINTITDLKGKKIAAPRGTAAEYALEQLLTAYDLTVGDIEFINLQSPALVPALVHGDIDAFIIWEPHVLTAKQQLGNNAVVFSTEQFYTSILNLVAKADYIQENKELLVKFAKAIVNAEEFVHSFPDEAIMLVAEHGRISPEKLKGYWDDETINVDLDSELLIDTLTKEGEWINNQKLKAEQRAIPNYFLMVTDSIISAVKTQ